MRSTLKEVLSQSGEGAATLNTAPSWITPGKMGVQG